MGTVVGILGVTHDPEMQATYHYPLSLMEELIRQFGPDVICGEVHPRSWRLYVETGQPYGILGETQEEYPQLIFPYCESRGVKFVPVNWFEEDVFDEGPFDRFNADTQQRLQRELTHWNNKQLATWDRGRIPLNSSAYDRVTQDMYSWLHEVKVASSTLSKKQILRIADSFAQI